MSNNAAIVAILSILAFIMVGPISLLVLHHNNNNLVTEQAKPCTKYTVWLRDIWKRRTNSYDIIDGMLHFTDIDGTAHVASDFTIETNNCPPPVAAAQNK